MRFLAGLVGFGVGLAIYWQLGQALMGGRDDRGVLALLVALPAALVGGATYAAYAETSRGRQGLIAYGLGVGITWFGFLAPVLREQRQAEAQAKAEARRDALIKARMARPTPTPDPRPVRDESPGARAAFLESLRDSGAHGPPGQVPPMLGVVEERDGRVVVKNRGGTPLHVALARVLDLPKHPALYWGCDMEPLMPGRTYAVIKPGETAFYDLGPRCPQELRQGMVEYRVGGSPGDVGWWSDSAFYAPNGRHAAYAAQHARRR